MGACIFSKLEVTVSHNENSFKAKISSLIDLRMMIIKHFSISESFNIYHGSHCIKTTNDLQSISKQERNPTLTIKLDDSNLKPHNSQLKIGNSFGILVLKKYLVCPAEKFNEDSIQKLKIDIDGNKFSLKKFYQFLDISGLALGKIKKSGKKPESLDLAETSAKNTQSLYTYRGTKKVLVSELGPNKDMIAALVYNEENTPVSVLSWNGNLSVTSLQLLKDSVQLAIGLAKLPSENLPLNVSGLNSACVPIYTELACCVISNRIIAYHPSDFGVNFYSIDRTTKDLHSHRSDTQSFVSVTQTPVGLIIVKKQNIWSFNLSTFQKLPSVPSNHEQHAAVLLQESLVVLGGKLNNCVDVLELSSFEWKTMPKLPHCFESPAACAVENIVYVIGGVVDDEPSDRAWRIRKGDDTWEMMRWKLPWTCVGAGAFAVDREIVVFGGTNNDEYVVLDNGEEVRSGKLGAHASFEGMQCGRVGCSAVIASRQGKFFKYDMSAKRFQLCEIGNHKE